VLSRLSFILFLERTVKNQPQAGVEQLAQAKLAMPGHWLMEERPRETMDTLIKFLLP